MDLDYSLIGRRIAKRRRQLGLKQSQVEEMAGLSYKYLSAIERGVSIPSTEVVMRLAIALDTTPDAFLTGAISGAEGTEWRTVAELLRSLDPPKLALAKSLLLWLNEQGPDLLG